MTSPLRRSRRAERWTLPLAFLLPFFICCLVFACSGFFPFGDKQIMASDEWHQYYPFLVTFREKLRTGGSMQYSWDVGMGTAYAPLYAYYLASPLYLFSALVPLSVLREYFALMTVMKLAFAGLFFAYFLKTVFRRSNLSMAVFALGYALCAWACGYYWNIIWLDAFALLPLLIAATVVLLRDGRFRLYVLALALTIWSNYYIGYMCCLFVALFFFAYCFVNWQGGRNFGKRFVRIALGTVLGVGMTAALLLPMLLAMQGTYSSRSVEVRTFAMNIAEGAYGDLAAAGGLWSLLKNETLPGMLSATRQVLTQLLTSPTITSMEGLPNIFCGLSMTTLSVLYLFDGRIRLREKLMCLLLLAFLVLSFLFRPLDYLWHGFHFPNMLPYRFSFLFPFVQLFMAYRLWAHRDTLKKWTLVPAALAGLLLIWNDVQLGDVVLRQTVLSALVLVGTILALAAYAPTGLRRTLGTVALCAVMVMEMSVTFAYGVDQVGITTRTGYPRDNDAVQQLLAYANGLEEGTPFFRMEMSETQTLNDGALNGYHGVSMFNSSANVVFNRFSHSLGLSAWPGSNRYAYYESTPFANTMCAIKYLLNRESVTVESPYTVSIASAGSTKLLRNESYIAPGFMVDSDFADFVSEEYRHLSLDEQARLFASVTGVAEPLYEKLGTESLDATADTSFSKTGGTGTSFRYIAPEGAEDAAVTVRYQVPHDGLVAVSVYAPSGTKEVDCSRNGELVMSRKTRVPLVFTLGACSAGDELTFSFDVDAGTANNISLQVAMQDDAVYERGLAALRDEPWQVTQWDDTCIKGTIDVKQDGIFYAAIPYERGWSATVDGEPVELAPTYDPQETNVHGTDAVISFPLTAGAHEIVLTYRSRGLVPGLTISGVCLLAFLALVIALRRRPVLLPDEHDGLDPAERVGRRARRRAALAALAGEFDPDGDEPSGEDEPLSDGDETPDGENAAPEADDLEEKTEEGEPDAQTEEPMDR